MSAALGNRNRRTHRAVVDLAREYISGEGVPVASYPRPQRLMDIGEEIHPDLDVAGVALSVTSRRSLRLSDDLDAAVGVANLSGSPVGAVLQWRSDRPIAESYAVLRLVDLIALVRTARATAP
ncbi:hypothetical protein DEU35_3046 [Microbacterium sp. AG157]|uniref:hypothetical protein n=1 Tax=Microbacterium sp. AG157 TaxID=2183993 RepID=UPI000E3A53E9|nr:hypothetical protein [Microbacterium sp. AG157]REC97281.1 hypothetical protein DEU35_3046 [Microbacterium sp. AG157]